MDLLTQELINDTISFLRETAKITPFLFATKEEAAHFAFQGSSRAPKLKKETVKLASPVIPQKKLAPQPVAPAPILPVQKIETVVVSKPLSPIPKKDLNEMRQTIQKTFPDLKLRETILDDSHAKKMSRLWEETYLSAQIIVIAFGETGIGLEFLRNVTQAIDRLIAPAQLIDGPLLEKEQGWDLLLSSPSLKAVLCSPWASWKPTSLSKHYKQNGSTQQQFLGSHKLFLMESSLAYLKNPDRKRKLWEVINTQLL